MILIDTNILIEIYKQNSKIIDGVKIIGQENIVVSDVTCAELYYGVRNKIELQAIRKDLDKLIVLPIEQSISKLAVELVEKYTLSHKLSLPDALLASTAIIHNLKFFTLNIKDFKFIEKLELYSIKELK